MKSTYLVLLLSCWWMVACIESNPQPMPHSGKPDTACEGDASSHDGGGQEEINVPPSDMSATEDLAASDILAFPDATDIGDVEPEFVDGFGDPDGVDAGVDADAVFLPDETVEADSEVTVPDGGDGDGKVN